MSGIQIAEIREGRKDGNEREERISQVHNIVRKFALLRYEYKAALSHASLTFAYITYTHKHIYKYTHTYYIYIHTHTHTHARIHTLMRAHCDIIGQFGGCTWESSEHTVLFVKWITPITGRT